MSRCRCKDHTFDCEALKTFSCTIISAAISMKSRPTSAFCGHAPYLGYGAFSAERAAGEAVQLGYLLISRESVLAVTTTVSMPKENRPFITLEF